MDFRAAESLGNVEEYFGGGDDHVGTVGLQTVEFFLIGTIFL